MLAGQNGQISLGHGALMAVGAYTVALLGESGTGRRSPSCSRSPRVVTAVAGMPAGAAAAACAARTWPARRSPSRSGCPALADSASPASSAA